MALTRRSFITSTTGSLTVFARSIRAQERDVEFAFRQYHNQTPESSLHKRLVQMWQGGLRRERRSSGLQGVRAEQQHPGKRSCGAQGRWSRARSSSSR